MSVSGSIANQSKVVSSAPLLLSSSMKPHSKMRLSKGTIDFSPFVSVFHVDFLCCSPIVNCLLHRTECHHFVDGFQFLCFWSSKYSLSGGFLGLNLLMSHRNRILANAIAFSRATSLTPIPFCPWFPEILQKYFVCAGVFCLPAHVFCNSQPKCLLSPSSAVKPRSSLVEVHNATELFTLYDFLCFSLILENGSVIICLRVPLIFLSPPQNASSQLIRSLPSNIGLKEPVIISTLSICA